jgi:flavin-dependent dehydrogenase
MTYDLIVIGAGPAGCATAITAARNGARVLLLEREHFPRHKVCGEFVSAESLSLLLDLLSPADQCLVTSAPRIQQARVFADETYLCLEICPPGASITRFELDRALWRACLLSGVDCRERCSVRSVCGQGPFSAATTKGAFHGQAMVNAAGRWSFLTSAQTRACAPRERWIGLKAHFREACSARTVDLYFFEGGYCGVQPAGGGTNEPASVVNACAMVRSSLATELKDVFAAHPALAHRSRNWEPLSRPVSTSPLIFHKPEPVQGGMLQAGDAATFVDPFIGDGISLALRSGTLAAQCLGDFLHHRSNLPSAMFRYKKLYFRRVAPVFRVSSILRTLLKAPPLVRKPALSLLRQAPLITRQIVNVTR